MSPGPAIDLDRRGGIPASQGPAGIRADQGLEAAMREARNRDRAGNTPPASALLERVLDFYHRRLTEGGAGLECLRGLDLADPTLIDAFRLGFCDGSLREALPSAGRVLDQLTGMGILDPEGNERFRDCIVVPVFDADGGLAGLWGRHTQTHSDILTPDCPAGLGGGLGSLIKGAVSTDIIHLPRFLSGHALCAADVRPRQSR